MLLSRWRTGGQTSFDLVREFVQELPHAPPTEAWQRAVLLAMDSRLSFDSEPRVKHAPSDEAPKASHPFFWAGYMLVDSGTAAEPSQAPDGPVIKLKKPDKAAEGKQKDEAPNDQKAVESPKGETDGDSPKDETKNEAAPKKPVKKKPNSKAKGKIEK